MSNIYLGTSSNKFSAVQSVWHRLMLTRLLLCHQSILTRIRHTLTNVLWKKYKSDPSFLQYFPDRFLKTAPPKKYFWQVFAAVKPNEYNDTIIVAKNRASTFKKIVRSNIKLTDQALEVFNDFVDDDLNLLSKFSR